MSDLMSHEEAWEQIEGDLISRADAMGAVQDHFNANGFKGYDDGQKMMDRIKALPSADAVEYESTVTLNSPISISAYKAESADAEQVTSKLRTPCDSLLKSDSAECKEQKSKLEHDRDWIIGCIKHDGFIKTDRFDKANQIILDALSADAEPTVIRSRTLLPTKDFKEWAKRIREVNPNAVVIPCDAEVVSADAVQGEWEHWGSPFSDESEVIDTIVCSVCGARFIEPKDEPKGEYNFCPSCGARMKGGADTVSREHGEQLYTHEEVWGTGTERIKRIKGGDE